MKNYFAIIAFSTAMLTGTAYAQVTQKVNPRFIPKLQPVLGSTSISSFKQNNNRDGVLISPDRGLAGGHALSSFAFNFENGDHKLNSIGLLTNAESAEVIFSDMDGNDPYLAEASYVISNRFINGEMVSGTQRSGEFNFTIDNPPANHTLVLRGFHILKPNGIDGNLRQIKVWINNNNNITIRISNQEGPDFRRLEVGHSHVSWAGIRGDSSSLLGQDNQSLRSDIRNMAGQAPYQIKARVQYTFVPNDMLGASAVLSGNGRTLTNGALPALNKAVLLRGFDFNFLNEDHHILQVGIKIPANRSEQAIFFQDNNQDDPINWRASFISLR